MCPCKRAVAAKPLPDAWLSMEWLKEVHKAAKKKWFITYQQNEVCIRACQCPNQDGELKNQMSMF